MPGETFQRPIPPCLTTDVYLPDTEAGTIGMYIIRHGQGGYDERDI